MNPNLLAAIAAYLRGLPAVVAAFGEDLAADPPIIKFWSDWAGTTSPALPYLVLTEPQDAASFETASQSGDVGPMRDGIVQADVLAASKDDARALGERLHAALTDPPLSVADTGLIYFRPTGHQFPIVANVGPDGSPTSFARIVQFRFLTEPQPS